MHDISPRAASHSLFSGRGSFRALPSPAAGGRQRPEGSSHTQRHTPLPHSFFPGEKKAPGDPIWLRCIKRGEGGGGGELAFPFPSTAYHVPRIHFPSFAPPKKSAPCRRRPRVPHPLPFSLPPLKLLAGTRGERRRGGGLSRRTIRKQKRGERRRRSGGGGALAVSLLS